MLRKDPLVHFLVIGALLFAALSQLAPGERPESILITADTVERLRQSATLLQGRPPTDDELAALVGDAVRDEVYYREALAQGLDADDTVVRQRLIEKMRELNENVVDPVPPATDLEAWFADNAAKFRIPELVSFDHVFFSPRERGEAVRADAEAALVALAGGADAAAVGDSTPLGARFATADAERVRVLFGDELTAAVFAAAPDRWIGPYESGFGWHLVRVVERSAARDPTFAEVEDVVREAYAAERLRAANAEALARMLERFDVSVEWQAGSAPESWP
jgi:parvulin-like peptidyl-prolyl isomerase